MKRHFISSLLLCIAVNISAGNRHVAANGSIQQAIDASSAGDTVLVTAGVYNQSINLKDGVNLIAEAGTILDGTGLDRRLISKEDGNCELPTLIEGFILQNARHNKQGGAALLAGNITMRHCIIRGCSGQQAGGILIKGDLAEASALGAHLEYCIIHNCSATGHCWPDAGGVANFDGIVSHCTICNNYGDRYGGIHSESTVENTVMWGNLSEDGFVDPANYISDESLSIRLTNYADEGFEEDFFTKPWLNDQNTADSGPCFRYPTNFSGVPNTNAEYAVMINADYSPSAVSPIRGKAGALSYEPRPLNTTSLDIVEDTLYITEGEEHSLHAIVSPYLADDKTVNWSTPDQCVILQQNGKVKALTPGTAFVKAVCAAGGSADSTVVIVTPAPVVIVHPQVLAADSLYQISDYTIPSFIPMLIAKETARKDSSRHNLQLLEEAISMLKNKNEPYCLVSNINGDPATRMAFCWFTNEGVEEGCVQIIRKKNATADDFRHSSKVMTVDANISTTPPLHYAISTSGILKAACLDKNTSYRYVSHKAVATNLRPGSDYSWRVGFEGHWSDIMHFRTEDHRQKSFSFVYMTDSHLQNREYIDAARLCAEAVARNERDARFCVFPGDFVDTGTKNNSEWEWERWFEESLKPVISIMPIVPTDGNHDDSPLLNYTYHFNTDSSFNTQSIVKPQFSGITYSFQYGEMLLMAFSMQDFLHGDYSYEDLTSEYFSRDLADWFERQVKDHPKARYRVALVHKNLFSGSDHQRDKETPLMRQTLLPVFKKCEMDLVLQCHDHTYEVIGPVDPDTRTPIISAISDRETVPIDSISNLTGIQGGTYDVSDGTMYFIGATCGAKRYTPLTRQEMDDAFETHHLHNYFDLFTGMFGQPGLPSYTRVTITRKAIILNSFKVQSDGTPRLFNSLKIVRHKPHTKLAVKSK